MFSSGKNTGYAYKPLAAFVMLGLILILAGCKEKLPKVPADVIPMNKMVGILIDMHITDAVAETRTMGGGAAEKKMSEEFYAQIYKNHGVTREEFLKSYAFYESNPALLNKLYDEILSEMSQREGSINK